MDKKEPLSLPAIIDQGWWDILKMTAAKSAEERPFATFALVVMAVVVLGLGQLFIWRWFRYLEVKEKCRSGYYREKDKVVAQAPRSPARRAIGNH